MKTCNYWAFVMFTMLFFGPNVNGQTISGEEDFNLQNSSVPHEFCGTDYFHNQQMKNDAGYRARYQEGVERIQKVASQKRTSPDGIMQVPVVVHVMHKGEPVGTGTNISDEDVVKGIQYLNNYWRKMPGTQGDGDGVDMKIEFALAIQDERGNCTNGIDRVDMSGVPAYVNNGVNRQGTGGISDYTVGGGVNSLKEYSIWDPTKYYNVWIVDEIDNKNCYTGGSFIAGYAYFASSHGNPRDGSVVLICSYLSESSSTWAHEMGHAFNLPHTFNGDNPETGKCGDDGIADTPSHIRTSSFEPSIYRECDNSDRNDCDPNFNQVVNPDTGFTRGEGNHQDHMHNYMDYTGCDSEFTGGQRAVAQDALRNMRTSFLTSPALIPPTTATVDFISKGNSACKGGTLSFFDASTCTPNAYTNESYDNITFLWTFDNGRDTPYTSTQQNPTITFDNAGVYDVTLAVTNPQGTTSTTKTDHIIVNSETAISTGNCVFSSRNNGRDFNNGVTKVSLNTIHNNTSTFIPTNATNDFICSYKTTLEVDKPYDLSVNYRGRTGGRQFVEVWIDWDNNGSFEISNTSGINERVLVDDIEAGSSTQKLVSVTPPTSAVRNTLLRMRVASEYNKVPVMCGEGRAQRADDYGIYVTDGSLSVNDLSESDDVFKVFPNPTETYLNMSLKKDLSISAYEIYDISGKSVLSNAKATGNQVNVSNLSKGFYFIKVSVEDQILTRKFIKK